MQVAGGWWQVAGKKKPFHWGKGGYLHMGGWGRKPLPIILGA